MKWVTNATSAPEEAVFVLARSAESDRTAALAYEIAWRRQFVVGDPKASEAMTVAELKSAGMIGLYRPDGGDAPA